MANMNMIIHDMEGEIEIGDTFKNPKFRKGNRLRTFDRVVANPMWNQDWFTEEDYDADELDRFPPGRGLPRQISADWGWVQHILASLNDTGPRRRRARHRRRLPRLGQCRHQQGKDVRQWFVEHDLIESVIYLPENLFYNTTAPGIVLFLNKAKPKERKGKVFLVNASQVFDKGRPQELHPRRRHPAHRRHLHRRGRKRKNSAASSITREIAEERLQHLPQPLHPHQRRRNLPAHRGDRRGTEGHRSRGAGNRRRRSGRS